MDISSIDELQFGVVKNIETTKDSLAIDSIYNGEKMQIVIYKEELNKNKKLSIKIALGNKRSYSVFDTNDLENVPKMFKILSKIMENIYEK